MKKIKHLILLIFLIVLSFTYIISQNIPTETQIVNKIVEMSRENNYFGVVELNNKKYYSKYYQTFNSEIFLDKLIKYKDDYSHYTTVRINLEIMNLAWRSTDNKIRKKAIEAFISTKIYTSSNWAEKLYKFKREDFSDKAKEMLKFKFDRNYSIQDIDKYLYTIIKDNYKDSVKDMYIKYKNLSETETNKKIEKYLNFKVEENRQRFENVIQKIEPSRYTVKLTAYIGMTELLPEIRVLAAKRKKHYKWDYLLALARMNDKEAIKSLIEATNTAKLGSPISTLFFRGIIYTRQRVLFDILIEKLQDENCMTASRNPQSSQKIPCGMVIMEQFPGIIENYPLKYSVGTQIDTDNYERAIETAREWFNNNKQYSIIDDKY